MNDFWNMAWLIFAGLLPFLGFLLVCFVVMRAVFNVDRNERKAMAQWDRQHGQPPNSQPISSSTVEDERQPSSPSQDQSQGTRTA